ncbi:MAG: transcriptional repressor NrdR [Elusimicrobia bacterium]|nr:transcriptional repressor NrdR [Elusimicrobiota bacterium]
MRCPSCDHPEDRVIDSRPLESATVIRRRRLCVNCGKRFTTYERVEATPLMVIKSDNRREPFNRTKIREGIRRACIRRPISPDTIEKLVSEIEYELQDYVLEVPSREIGERILKKLYLLDPVAYVRFASVYKKFADLDAFLRELKKLKRIHQREQARTRTDEKNVHHVLHHQQVGG